MIAKGVENADAIVAACKKTIATLDAKLKPEWQAILESVISAMEGMGAKFFLKTNFAIPVTNACLKDATELEALATKGDFAKFPEALARLQVSLEKLVSRSKMEGVSLT